MHPPLTWQLTLQKVSNIFGSSNDRSRLWRWRNCLCGRLEHRWWNFRIGSIIAGWVWSYTFGLFSGNGIMSLGFDDGAQGSDGIEMEGSMVPMEWICLKSLMVQMCGWLESTKSLSSVKFNSCWSAINELIAGSNWEMSGVGSLLFSKSLCWRWLMVGVAFLAEWFAKGKNLTRVSSLLPVFLLSLPNLLPLVPWVPPLLYLLPCLSVPKFLFRFWRCDGAMDCGFHGQACFPGGNLSQNCLLYMLIRWINSFGINDDPRK